MKIAGKSFDLNSEFFKKAFEMAFLLSRSIENAMNIPAIENSRECMHSELKMELVNYMQSSFVSAIEIKRLELISKIAESMKVEEIEKLCKPELGRQNANSNIKRAELTKSLPNMMTKKMEEDNKQTKDFLIKQKNYNATNDSSYLKVYLRLV